VPKAETRQSLSWFKNLLLSQANYNVLAVATQEEISERAILWDTKCGYKKPRPGK
jgi:hypothetical protein